MRTVSTPTGKLYDIGKKLLETGRDYWEEYQGKLSPCAVVWLESDDGSLVVFTRGEYADELKDTIEGFDNHLFRDDFADTEGE
jgi:hypothetical protein